MRWHAHTATVGDCSGALIPESNSSVIAELDGDSLIVDTSYDTAPVSINIDCQGTGGTMTVQVTPAPLTITVPAAGGTLTVSQVLEGPGNDLGLAVAIVTKVGAE